MPDLMVTTGISSFLIHTLLTSLAWKKNNESVDTTVKPSSWNSIRYLFSGSFLKRSFFLPLMLCMGVPLSRVYFYIQVPLFGVMYRCKSDDTVPPLSLTMQYEKPV